MSDPIVDEKIINEKMRLERLKQASLVLNSAQYGLIKGQHVSRHTRIDPRTGRKFVAGQGGSGSARVVLGEGKTVAPSLELGDALGVGGEGSVFPESFIPEESIANPDTLETVIRNLENASPEDLMSMADDLFKMPKHRDRGTLAELMLKEILRRGIVKPSKDEENSIKEESKKQESMEEENKEDVD